MTMESLTTRSVGYILRSKARDDKGNSNPVRAGTSKQFKADPGTRLYGRYSRLYAVEVGPEG